jgi:hypothetical protein
MHYYYNMKNIIFIISLLSFYLNYGQDFKLEVNGVDTLYTLIKYNLLNTYPDGRWVYKDIATIENKCHLTFNHYFFVKNNKVNGSYLKESKCLDFESGTYNNDSLWTFITDPFSDDFKVAEWRSVVGCCINELHSFPKMFDIPYDENGDFEEKHFDSEGNIKKIRFHNEEKGVSKWFTYENDGKLNGAFNKYDNYWYEYSAVNDSLKEMKFGTDKLNVLYSVYKSPKGNVGLELINLLDTVNYTQVVEITLDSNNNVKSFEDKSNGIFYGKDWEGNLFFQYKNKKGKLIRKKVKSN